MTVFFHASPFTVQLDPEGTMISWTLSARRHRVIRRHHEPRMDDSFVILHSYITLLKSIYPRREPKIWSKSSFKHHPMGNSPQDRAMLPVLCARHICHHFPECSVVVSCSIDVFLLATAIIRQISE